MIFYRIAVRGYAAFRRACATSSELLLFHFGSRGVLHSAIFVSVGSPRRPMEKVMLGGDGEKPMSSLLAPMN